MPEATKKTGVNIRAAINHIKINSLPSFYYSGGHDIIPYGLDNLYPDRILEAIKKSPTAKGCVKREREFIFGHGVNQNIVVNRLGETLNDIIYQCIAHGYSPLGGFNIHLNFNALGQICEMFFVSLENIRIHKTLNKIDYGVWNQNLQGVFLDQKNITVDIYNEKKLIDQVSEAGGIENFKGAIACFSKDLDIYPTSPLDSASISAAFEREAQIYPYANIKNGFSGNTVLKLPTMSDGAEAEEEADNLQKKIESVHGSENAGSTIIVTQPVNAQGEAKPYTMVEHLSPSNVDTLFVNQNEKAEQDILKCYTMPQILLGITSEGMFNEASFVDAFNYKNSDTEQDRKNIERFFNKILPRSCFGISSIEINPLQIKQKDGGSQSVSLPAEAGKEDSSTTNSGISEEQLQAQANLKGSVGGVQGILQIQESFSQGTTTLGSALSILKLIYGFNDEDARALLGNPEEATKGGSQNG